MENCSKIIVAILRPLFGRFVKYKYYQCFAPKTTCFMSPIDRQVTLKKPSPFGDFFPYRIYIINNGENMRLTNKKVNNAQENCSFFSSWKLKKWHFTQFWPTLSQWRYTYELWILMESLDLVRRFLKHTQLLFLVFISMIGSYLNFENF